MAEVTSPNLLRRADPRLDPSYPALRRREQSEHDMRYLRTLPVAEEALKSLPVARSLDAMLAQAVPSGPAGVSRTIPGQAQEGYVPVSGNTMPGFTGVTSGASSTAIPPGPTGDLRRDSNFSFKDPGHVVTQDERDRSAFAHGKGTEFASGGQIQFQPDDARRPGQVQQQEYDMMMEDRARRTKMQDLLYAKQLADAEAAMRFTADYGVPYDPQVGKFTLEAQREAAMDEDFDVAMEQLNAARATGVIKTEEEFMSKALALAEQYGVRKAAPTGYFQSTALQRQLGADRGMMAGVDAGTSRP